NALTLGAVVFVFTDQASNRIGTIIAKTHKGNSATFTIKPNTIYCWGVVGTGLLPQAGIVGEDITPHCAGEGARFIWWDNGLCWLFSSVVGCFRCFGTAAACTRSSSNFGGWLLGCLFGHLWCFRCTCSCSRGSGDLCC